MTASQVPDTSTTLLRDVADSSHARWSVFYSRYQPMMRSYLQARFPSLDADDIIQETFVALAKILPDYQYAPERTPAAAKVLTRDDEVTKKRFHDEIDFLAQNQLPQFPRYFESEECNVFVRPMQLKANHEYWVVGPGILDASVTSAGTNTTIRLKNCVFLNRSSVPLKNTGIRYVFQGGAYLNFTNLDRPEDFTTRQFQGFDGAFDEIRFKGPETIKGLNELRNKESWERLKKDVSNHYFWPDKSFFHLPRHILCSKPEYIMESMEKKDTKAAMDDESFDFNLDSNRVRTDAEIRLFADVFSISFDEARQILKKAGGKCQS